MEAATISSGNEIFVFDMGESVRIADLARRDDPSWPDSAPARRSRIAYTGLRPGEKLYEEVLSIRENTKPRPTRRSVWRACASTTTSRPVLRSRSSSGWPAVDVAATVRLLKHTIPEYKSRNSAFEEFDRTPVAAQ